MGRSTSNIYATGRKAGGSICTVRRLGVFILFSIAALVLFGGEGEGEPPKKKTTGENTTALRGSAPAVDTDASPYKYEPPQLDDDFYTDDEKTIDADATDDDGYEETTYITPSLEEGNTLEETISEAIMDIDEVEEEEIQANQNLLKGAMKKMNDLVKIGLGRLFGDSDDVSDEELEEIADEIAAKLEDQVQEELHQKADALADNKADEIEDVVEEDEDVGIKTKNIKEDVKQVEQIAQADLRDEIDEVADQVKGKMKEKAAKIEKEVIEKKLGKKMKIENGVVKKESKEKKKEEKEATKEKDESETAKASSDE